MDASIPTRRTRPATDREVAAIRAPGRHSVGGGLILVFTPGGTRSWIARITDPTKRRRDIGLGPYPEVSLKDARRRALELRNQARDGIDPLAAKRAAAVGVMTFKAAALQFHSERDSAFRNKKLADQWLRTLRDYSFAAIGSLPVDQVSGALVVKLLKPIWQEKPETAGRVFRRIAAVIAWAVGHEYREHELPMASIRNALGKQRRTVVSHPAVSFNDAAQFMTALRARDSMSALALELAILTAARSGEARGAKWDEINFEAQTWSVPAGRMKTAREHVVPLSAPAVALLRGLDDARDASGLIFPSHGLSRLGRLRGGRQPLSDVALSKVQKSIAIGTTVHGWRSAFRTWCAEMVVQLPGEIAEAALAHTNPNQVEARYRRTNYLEFRRPLMEAWGAFIGGDAEWESNLPEFRAARIHKIGQAA